MIAVVLLSSTALTVVSGLLSAPKSTGVAAATQSVTTAGTAKESIEAA